MVEKKLPKYVGMCREISTERTGKCEQKWPEKDTLFIDSLLNTFLCCWFMNENQKSEREAKCKKLTLLTIHQIFKIQMLVFCFFLPIANVFILETAIVTVSVVGSHQLLKQKKKNSMI